MLLYKYYCVSGTWVYLYMKDSIVFDKKKDHGIYVCRLVQAKC